MKQHRYLIFAAICTAVVLIAGCGGGGGSTTNNNPNLPPNNPGPASTGQLTGVAAAGAPISGIVNVKGANNATASSTIGVDGAFNLDVTNLTAPYILYAEGSVNGKAIKIFSAAINDGLINITPVTDFILRNALGGSADTAFNNWANTQVSEAALATAESNVQVQLGPVLTAANVAADANLLTSAFTADSTGIDAMLDVIDINYNGNIATVSNKVTGSSYTDDITLTGDSAGLPATDANSTSTALTDAEAINAFWQSFEDLFATTPSNAAFTTWINNNVANDFFSEGETKTEMRDGWLADGLAEEVGITVSSVIIEPMDVTGTSYTKGYWIIINYSTATDSGSDIDAMVFDGANWLWYGDRRWVAINGVNPHASYADAVGIFSTGFELGIDDDSNYAYGQDVRSALVTGPGLPANGVLLAHQFPETFIGVHPGGHSFYQINDDALIATIPDNAEYAYTLCSETADELVTNGYDTCTMLDTYTTITMKPPLPKSALDASMFAALTSPNSHDLSDLSFGGLINVSWTNPVGTHSAGISMGWTLSGQEYFVSDDVGGDITAGTLDTIGLPMPDTGFATVFVRVSDIYGRHFNRHWWFSN